MIWIQAYMICIQIIYDFKIIYDLAYDLKTCWHMICFNIIYGIICDLAQRSYKHPYMVENGPYMIWNPCPHMIWNPHMITIYGLVDIWSHIWSLNPMRCSTTASGVRSHFIASFIKSRLHNQQTRHGAQVVAELPITSPPPPPPLPTTPPPPPPSIFNLSITSSLTPHLSFPDVFCDLV